MFFQYHPAAVFYNRKLANDIKEDWLSIKPYLHKEAKKNKMSNETFLIPIKQNDDLSDIALDELRADLDDHPLNQRFYSDYAYLPGNAKKYSLNRINTRKSPLMGKKILFFLVLQLLLALVRWVRVLLIISGKGMVSLLLKTLIVLATLNHI